MKKPKLGPKLKGPLPTTRLTDTLKKPFKTPFKDITSFIDAVDSPERSDAKVSEDGDEVIVIEDDSESLQYDGSAQEVIEELEDKSSEVMVKSLIERGSCRTSVWIFDATITNLELQHPYWNKPRMRKLN